MVVKTFILTLITITAFTSFSGFAQNFDVGDSNNTVASAEMQRNTLTAGSTGLSVKSYHVEEIIQMNFGGTTTTYDVSDISMVNTNDLGPNNIRIVTPKYVQKAVVEPRSAVASVVVLSANPAVCMTQAPTAAVPTIAEHKNTVAFIYLKETFQRMASKGIKSVEMFKRLGNMCYFDGELEQAATWYGELLELTSDFEAEIYFRYSKSLDRVGQRNLAEEMMERYHLLNK